MPASGRFLLDTEVVVALLRGDSGVRQRAADAAEVFLSTVSLGELYYGALCSERPDENRKRVEEFGATAALLGLDEATATMYAATKHDLRTKGRPIPENDIWIAATARRHALQLVSSDVHFKGIEGLDVTSW